MISKELTKASRCIRVLHVLGRMDYGGIETWLMHLLRNIDREKFKLDFLIHTSGRARFDDEIGCLGSRIIRCLNVDQPWLYAKQLRMILAQNGPYEVVHSHVHHYSGWVLRTAHRAGVPIRIAHSHTANSVIIANEKSIRKLYYRIMRILLKRHATLGLAASTQAGEALWGVDWQGDSQWRTLFCGIDLNSFMHPVDRQTIRSELGIPSDSIVIGHVGSFNSAKNHDFLLQIGAEAIRINGHSLLLVIGDGGLKQQVESKAVTLGIRDKVIFTGTRADIPRILSGAIDVFVFPSLYEGLPLSVVEAQAAGLPVVLSDSITREVEIVPELLSWISLRQAPGNWANVALARANQAPCVAARNAYLAIKKSQFNIHNGVKELSRIYERGV